MKTLEVALAEVARCHELVVPISRLQADPSLAAQPPGVVRRYADGGALLHMGPGRWLLVGRALEWESATVTAAEACGGLLVDVSAKWRRLSVTGTRAELHLSRLLSVTQVLHERGCAPVAVLDCPAVLARCEDGFELWVARSWAAWLHESLSAIDRDAEQSKTD
jgi:heterotetrameric sarcosine oxidase gamma subunit